MRKFNTVSMPALAIATSLLLLGGCGGGDDDVIDPTATTSTTTSSTEASTTTTTTDTTTTTTLAPQSFSAAQLIVQHSNHCLSAGANTAGSAVTQAVCAATAPAQRWKITPSGSDFTITNNSSNLCMGVANADMTPGAAIVQLACDGAANTLWTLQPSATQGQFNLIAKHSNQCLDIFASDLAPGTAAVQFTCSGAANQPNQRVVIAGQ